jgi:hypothetical protein
LKQQALQPLIKGIADMVDTTEIDMTGFIGQGKRVARLRAQKKMGECLKSRGHSIFLFSHFDNHLLTVHDSSMLQCRYMSPGCMAGFLVLLK